jgi:hypothetical protein
MSWCYRVFVQVTIATSYFTRKQRNTVFISYQYLTVALLNDTVIASGHTVSNDESVNNILERMWKETVVANFVTFSRNLPGGNQG